MDPAHNHNMMNMDTSTAGHNMHDHMNHTTMDHAAMGHTTMDHSMHHGHGDMGDMSGMGGMDGMGHMDMMKMYFHTGVKEYILFEQCHTESTGAMIGACFAVFFVAILYEGLKCFREILLQRSLRVSGPTRYMESTIPEGSSKEQIVTQAGDGSISNRMLSSSHCFQTVLHVIQVFISYCLMLVFMTYNVWLCVSVIAGAGLGYFMFGWKRAVVVDANEHCH